MKLDEFRNLFILDKETKTIGERIPDEVLKFALWYSFNGKKSSYSWQRSHEELPLFKTFGTKPIPIVDFAFQTGLNVKVFSVNLEDIDKYTLEDLGGGALLLDENLLSYKDDEKKIIKGFFMAFSQSLRNALAHGIFGLWDDLALFCDTKERNADINFAFGIKMNSIPKRFRWWYGFASKILFLDDARSIVAECIKQLGFDVELEKDAVVVAADSFHEGWRFLFPTTSLFRFGTDAKKRSTAKSIMAKHNKTLVVFPCDQLSGPNGRNYLFVDEWYKLAKKKGSSRSIKNIIRRVGYEG